MRPSTLPNLVLAAKRNADRGVADAALFEIGPIYLDDTPEGQLLVAGGVRVGATPRHWGQASRPVDALDAKADALAVLTQLGLAADAPRSRPRRPPGTTRALGRAQARAQDRGRAVGALHPAVLAALDIDTAQARPRGRFRGLPRPPARTQAKKARPLLKLSPFHPVERDFAFVVDAGVPPTR